MPISCHFRDCKALLVTSPTHVSGTIASVQTFKEMVELVTDREPAATYVAVVNFSSEVENRLRYDLVAERLSHIIVVRQNFICLIILTVT